MLQDSGCAFTVWSINGLGLASDWTVQYRLSLQELYNGPKFDGSGIRQCTSLMAEDGSLHWRPMFSACLCSDTVSLDKLLLRTAPLQGDHSTLADCATSLLLRFGTSDFDAGWTA